MAKDSIDPALALLDRVQKLLRDSSYTTTYKFALLRALCDLSVELPDNTSSIELQTIAERFIHLYWRQVQPFTPPNQDKEVQLVQCSMKNKPSKVISLVQQCAKESGRSLSNAQQSGRIMDYTKLVQQQLVKDVLWRLQPEGDPFLYIWKRGQDSIQLLPGVLATLRRFHALLCDLIDGAWTRWVERRNVEVRSSDALRKHLFGSERMNIESVREPLIKLQQGVCFYSGKELRKGDSHIDHFIPWSLARHEALGNLVVCTATANLKWSNALKPAKDRAKLEARNTEHAPRLVQIARANGLRWDPRATLAVTQWAYASAG